MRSGALVLVGLGLAVALALPAGATMAKKEQQVGVGACVLAAVTYDGTSTAGGEAAESMVSAGPFPELTTSKNKKLRRLVRALVKDPLSATAVHEFGEWCQDHFPKHAVIRNAKYEVNAAAPGSR